MDQTLGRASCMGDPLRQLGNSMWMELCPEKRQSGAHAEAQSFGHTLQEMLQIGKCARRSQRSKRMGAGNRTLKPLIRKRCSTGPGQRLMVQQRLDPVRWSPNLPTFEKGACTQWRVGGTCVTMKTQQLFYGNCVLHILAACGSGLH